MALGNVVGPFISTTPVVYPFIEVLYVCLCVCESVLHLSRLCAVPAELESVSRGHRPLKFCQNQGYILSHQMTSYVLVLAHPV